MLEISNIQLASITRALENDLAIKLFQEFEFKKFPYLSLDKKIALNKLRECILEAKKWQIETVAQVKEYVILALTEKKMNNIIYQKEIERLMTWPKRSVKLKIEYLIIFVKD